MRSGGPAQSNCGLQPTVHLVEDGALVFRSIDAGTHIYKIVLLTSNNASTDYDTFQLTKFIMVYSLHNEAETCCDKNEMQQTLENLFYMVSLISRKCKAQVDVDSLSYFLNHFFIHINPKWTLYKSSLTIYCKSARTKYTILILVLLLHPTLVIFKTQLYYRQQLYIGQLPSFISFVGLHPLYKIHRQNIYSNDI